MTGTDEALSYIRRLLAILAKHGGYSTPSQQATMRGARRLLEEQDNPSKGETK